MRDVGGVAGDASLEPPLLAYDLARKLAAEALGTALLLAIVIGSGIMGERLSGGNVAIALLGNTVATGAGLVVLITIFGPLSGAHFNPAVTLVFALRREIAWGAAIAYVAVQIAAAIPGVWLAHAMFAEPVFQVSANRLHLLRQPGGDHRPLIQRHLRRHRAGLRAGLRRGAVRGRPCGGGCHGMAARRASHPLARSWSSAVSAAGRPGHYGIRDLPQANPSQVPDLRGFAAPSVMTIGWGSTPQRMLKTSSAVWPRIFWAFATVVASNTAWMALRV